jgi:hypothetical protein
MPSKVGTIDFWRKGEYLPLTLVFRDDPFATENPERREEKDRLLEL